MRAREERQEKRRGLDEIIRREKQDSGDERRQDRVEDRLRRIDERLGGLRAARRERREEGGRRIVIEEPDNRRIVRENNRVIIRHDENVRLRRRYRDVREERRGRELFTEFRRPNGVVIVTVTGEDGRLLRRLRRGPGGRESILFNNASRRGGGYYEDSYIDLPPLRRPIARNLYIVEADEASEYDIETALAAGPLEELDRGYTLDEVRASIRIRERMRSVDLDSITFDFGSWELGNNQFARLESVAEVLKGIIERNPDEVFLIEGHTDAVGSDIDNLSLSDRRAETIANVLQDEFNVPAENLVTQGYGEQYLKIDTQDPERENRRATVRRITPLLSGNADRGEARAR